MTAILDKAGKPKSRPKADKGSLVAAVGYPQVNLLPPEVHQARSLQTLKRWLALALLVVLVLAGVAYVVATMVRAEADDRLANALDEQVRLQTEERKYAEVPQVLGALDDTKEALGAGFGTEVQWQPYMDAISAVLPAGVSFDSFAIAGPTPQQPALAPSDPLQDASVGLVSFQARTLTLPDTAAWMDALNGVPGLSDAWVSSAGITADGEAGGQVYYTVAATVQITAAALDNRFADIPDPAQSAAPADEAADDAGEEG